MKKNLLKRTLTSLIGIPLLIMAISHSSWAYFGVFLLIQSGMLIEFYQLAKKNDFPPLKSWGFCCASILYTVSFLVIKKTIAAQYLYTLPGLVAFTYILHIYQKKAFTSLTYTLLGILYINIPFCLLHCIAFFQNQYTPLLIISILILIWTNDTSAYFVGSQWGKHKLFPSISPKKTWEGAISGILLTSIASIGIGYYIYILSTTQWLLLGFVVSITGIYGDLIESVFKRSMKIKDSGKIILGHGGMLDRFDSLLVAIPFILFFFKIIVENF